MQRTIRRKVLRPGRLALYAVLTAGSLVMVYPMVYGVVSSLCSIKDFYTTTTPWLPIPRSLYLSNYLVLLGLTEVKATSIFTAQVEVLRWIMNTLVRIIWYIAIPGVISVLAGYVFARLRFRGREAVFFFLLSSMMVPGIINLIPTFIFMARWPLVGGNNLLGQGGHGFVNEWGGLLIPNLVSVYYIFLLRQTFLSIPRDFEEAAEVDGASRSRILLDIYLPMIKPTLTVLVIFQAVGVWNDYIWPLIVSTGNKKLWTIGIGATKMMYEGRAVKQLLPAEAGGAPDHPFAFAMATLLSLPPILLFVFMQRYFIEGVQGFAIKG